MKRLPERLRQLACKIDLAFDDDPETFGLLQHAADELERYQWQPIETAPEYTEVIVWPYPTDYCMTAIKGKIRNGGDYGWHFTENTCYGIETYKCAPSHWMPLPLAPKEQVE